ncbi:MAG: hypothetical protein ABSF52_21950 [Syntrophobacteraceae bacterium]|jgi:hypothetical protein
MECRHCVKDFELMEALDGNRGAFELWGAVLLQAIEDFHLKGRSSEIVMSGIKVRWRTNSTEMRRNKRSAATWFGSSCEDVGSFLWICDLFGLDADLVRAKVKNKDFKLTW